MRKKKRVRVVHFFIGSVVRSESYDPPYKISCLTSCVSDHQLEYRTRRCMSHYHTPLDRFPMVDISTMVGIVPAPNRSTLETFRRDLSEDASFGIGTLLVVEQSSLEDSPRVCV